MPVGPATIPVTRSVYKSYAVVSATPTPAHVRGYVFGPLLGLKALAHWPRPFFISKQTSLVKKIGGFSLLFSTLLRLAEQPKERILGPKFRVLYTASRLIFKSTNTSYAWHPHNRR